MKHLIFLFLFPLCLFAKNKPEYAIFLIDTSLLENANAVIRSHSTVFDVHSASTATLTKRMVVTRFNESAAYENVYASYDKYTKVTALSASLYDAFGNLLRRVKKNEIQDIAAYDGSTMAQDNRSKYIDLTYGKYPYTIEYEYEIEYSDIMYYPFWQVQNFKTAVEKSDYLLKLPKSIDYKYQLHKLDIQPQTSETEEQKIAYWLAENVAAVLYEPRMPERRKQLAMGIFSPTKFEVEGYVGDMSSWESFGQFMYLLNVGRDELSPNMKAKVRELTQDLRSDEEKIAVLYRYMQENMRYVSIQLGIGGWQTFDANYVEKNKYGDCKALSNFMKGMLREANITAYTAIVQAERNLGYDATEDFAQPMFNHVILHIPEEDYWLECTSTENPPNFLGYGTTDRNVLLVTEEGGKLIRTPKPTAESDFERHNTHIKVDETGAARLEDEVSVGGGTYESYQAFLYRNTSENEQRKTFLEGMNLPASQIAALDIELSRDVPEGKISYTLDIPRYASRGGKRMFIPVNLHSNYSHVPDADDARINPVVVRYGYIEQDSIRISLPENARIESVPKPVEIKSDYGDFQLTFTQKEQQILCVRNLKIKPIEIPAKDYNAWRDFCKQVARKDKSKIVAILE